jgi:hypothetical protein
MARATSSRVAGPLACGLGTGPPRRGPRRTGQSLWRDQGAPVYSAHEGTSFEVGGPGRCRSWRSEGSESAILWVALFACPVLPGSRCSVVEPQLVPRWWGTSNPCDAQLQERSNRGASSYVLSTPSLALVTSCLARRQYIVV